ncbi:MAG: polysaccharide deacetylase family protein [Candidatus Riflebacteria bacterium]|nr:polysaccharide deacetylase family protein [Candidatus Riflebacteria bacterium]
MNSISVPVLYYHRIGGADPQHLSIPTDIFEKQMGFLKRSGYKSIFLHEFLDFLQGKQKESRKLVMITFDDGFRDNFENAHKVLKKFQLKATIFGCSGLIRPEAQRPSEKALSVSEAFSLAFRGDFSSFLSKSEMEKMYDSGVWEFQSHSHSHSQVFSGSKIESIFPEVDNHWGILSAYKDPLLRGSWPVFPRKSGLISQAFFPKIMEIRNNFPVNSLEKMRDFIGKELNIREYFQKEDEKAFELRVLKELEESKHFFSGYHRKNVDGICWPWGKYSRDLIELAKKVGYKAAFTTQSGVNSSGTSPFEIKRFPIKKLSQFRFVLGVWLRSHAVLAKIYGRLRAKF